MLLSPTWLAVSWWQATESRSRPLAPCQPRLGSVSSLLSACLPACAPWMVTEAGQLLLGCLLSSCVTPWCVVSFQECSVVVGENSRPACP